MNNNPEYEYEIDLKDLCVSVLRRWRQILLAAVICALLSGGFRLVQNLTSDPGLVMSESELETAQKDIDTARSQISSLEASIADAENSISVNEKTLENLDSKISLAESQLENLNSYLENYTAALDKLMESDELDAEIFDTLTEYLVQIDTIQSSILAKETEISDLYDSGPEMEAANLELQEQISDYEDQIAEQEEVIADLEAQMEEETAVSPTGKVFTYAVLGALIGACCVCAYAFLKYCFDKTIHLENDLCSYTGNPVIASVMLSTGNQSRKGRVDRLIDRMAGLNDSDDHSLAVQSAIAAAKIQVLSGTNRIFVTGTIGEELLLKIYESLKNNLPEGDFEVTTAPNPMYSAEEILKIRDYELVLVEAPHLTKVRELTDLNGFLKLSGAKVIGVISVSE